MKYHVDETETWKLESCGNGLSYCLTHKPSQMDVFVQGDDAIAFETDKESIELCKSEFTFDQVIAWLWDQMSWGMAAQPAGGVTA